MKASKAKFRLKNSLKITKLFDIDVERNFRIKKLIENVNLAIK